MTKARDLANIISGGFTVDDLPTLTASEIPNLDASKITSGTFADARIAASNVSQHATSFDDNKIVNDISTLGLRVHTQENLNASNTNSASFDVFQDSSGITNLTNSLRDSNEFISTGVLSSTTYSGLSPTYSLIGGFDSAWSNQHSKMTDNDTGVGFGTNPPQSNDKGFKIDFGQSYTFNSGSLKLGGYRTNGDPRQYTITYSTDDNTYSNIDFSSCSSSTVSSTGSASTMTSGTSAGVINLSGHTTNQHHSLINITTVPTFVARYIKVIMTAADYHDNNAYISQFDWGTVGAGTTNATGSFEGNAITASSTSKMGAVITYQDNAGTNTLNTDIIMKLSANNGSNYTTATLTTLPDFSTGIKMAKVNDLSVTAGTQLKYKIEFANQATGSKEARIRGVSLQY